MSILATANNGLYYQNMKGQHFLVLFNGKLFGKRKEKANAALYSIAEEYYPEMIGTPGNNHADDWTFYCTRLADVTISQDECGTMNYHAHGAAKAQHGGGYGIAPENFKYRIV